MSRTSRSAPESLTQSPHCTHTHRTCATVSGYRSGLDTTHCRTSVSHSEYLQLSPQQQPKESLSPGRTARAVTSLVVRSSLVSHFPMHATTLLVSRIWALIARQRSASPQARAPDSCSLPVSAKASQGKLRQPLHRDLADGHCVYLAPVAVLARWRPGPGGFHWLRCCSRE